MTRSTNSPELFVSVFCDGSAQRTLGVAGVDNTFGIRPASYPPGSADVLAFLRDLDAVGDVSAIPAPPAPSDIFAGTCPKSVSFGTFTTVTAQGKTSGDLQCIEPPTPAETSLTADCKKLAPWP